MAIVGFLTHLLPFIAGYISTISAQNESMSDILSEMSDEKRLVNYLYRKYEVYGIDGRPVKNSSHPVWVEFGLGLIKLELMEKENMLSMSTWARYRWRDEYLQWDPLDYGNVTNVKMAHSKVWTPDVMLYNTADADESFRVVRVVVQHDGTVTWFPHKVFRSSCAIDVHNFPFDNQTCHLWFGSWTHPLSEMNVNLAFNGGIDLSTFKSVYKDASEWEIFNNTAERLVMPEDGPPQAQFTILAFKLELKRKMMFSTYILTMPAIFLSFLTLLVFWLPPEHADKSALGLTIFGSLLLLLLILVEAAPPTASAVPLLGVYYCFTTVIVILSIFLSSLVMKVGRPRSRRTSVPAWANLIFVKGLGRVLFVEKLSPNLNCLSADRRRAQFTSVDCHINKDGGHQMDHVILRDQSEEEESRINGTTSLWILEKRMKSLNVMLGDLIKKQTDKELTARTLDDLNKEWHYLAMVLDRLFFVCYLVVIIISLCLLFPRPGTEGEIQF